MKSNANRSLFLPRAFALLKCHPVRRWNTQHKCLRLLLGIIQGSRGYGKEGIVFARSHTSVWFGAIVALVSIAPADAAAQAALTTVQDTVYLADGAGAQG